MSDTRGVIDMSKVMVHRGALAFCALLFVASVALSDEGEGQSSDIDTLTSQQREQQRLHRIGIDLQRIGINNRERKTPPRPASRIMDVETAKRKLAAAAKERDHAIRNQFCDQPPFDQLCAEIPKDNIDFTNLFVYSFILAKAQDSFDIFSWQSFIAMNWPIDENGPMAAIIGSKPSAPRAWFDYKTPEQIFDPDYQASACADRHPNSRIHLRLNNFRQTGGRPLIDRNLNYVLYDIRVNDVFANYIIDNDLDRVEGQLAFAAAGNQIDIPLGYYDDEDSRTGGQPASAAMKSAWKIIDRKQGDDPSRYYTVPALVSVDAKDSESGQPLCLEVEVGLVGMHIMQRTKTGNGREWTWSTFEHVDNAPLAVNSRKPIDTLHRTLFEGGCQGPTTTQQQYAFYNARCENCPSNSIDHATWKWASTMPYAASHATQNEFGTQVVRCWRVFEGTQDINAIWQQKLRGTVWANYQSSSAQWKGANRGKMFPQGEVPRFLINTTMETYDQYGSRSSCLSCHADARTVAGTDANFSFLPGLAAKYQQRRARPKLAKLTP